MPTPTRKLMDRYRWGGWSSGHGLTLKGLEGGGSRFESLNEKRLEKKTLYSWLMLTSILNGIGCTAIDHLDPLLLQA